MLLLESGGVRLNITQGAKKVKKHLAHFRYLIILGSLLTIHFIENCASLSPKNSYFLMWNS